MTKKTWMFLISLTIIVGALLACGSSTDTNTNTGSIASSSTSSTPTAAPAKHFKVGDVVNVGGIWQITITKIRTSQGNDYEKPKDGNQFIILSTVMKNISNKEQDSFGAAPYALRDTEGTQMELGIFVDDSVQQEPSGKVEAGSQIKGDLVYEVPKATKKLQLFYSNNMFEGGQTIWDISM